MKKKLPGIYKGTVKAININQKQAIFSKNYEEEKTEIAADDKINYTEGNNINRKIKDIFSSPSYVYRANVTITMQDGAIIKKTIIGRTNNSLITIDDELIDVSKISQIDFLD
ncbi:MAG: hypothetical protein J6B64_00685 [Bacilli bacterium]|nr:hypothetical protein [Bacilli bacterium]MBP3635390.1 hypothetical protein [Bacilli bacterium]